MSKIMVPLSGGLGNQLFQYYAGKSLDPKNLIVDFTLGKPKVNKYGQVEVFEFLTEKDYRVESPKVFRIQKLARKTFGFCTLYSSKIPSGKTPQIIYHLALTVASSLIFTIYFGRPCRSHISKGIGIPSRIRLDSFGTVILIGYFQTLFPFEKRLDYIQSEYTEKAREKNIPDYQLSKIASSRNLIIHMRLGDYLKEPKIGCLDIPYFARSISYFASRQEIDRIILFSDNEEFARRELQPVTTIPIEICPTTDLSSAETLYLLSYSRNFVISNSSFAWWAALISSFRQDVTIVAPKKWFAGQTDPISLIPSNWVRIESSWRLL